MKVRFHCMIMKIQSIFAILMLLAVTMLAGCSSEDDKIRELENGPFEGIIYSSGGKPVESSPLSVFFTKELHSPYYYETEDGRHLKDMTFFDEGNKDSCLIINSVEDFQTVYKGSSPLPEVDFSNNSIFLCRTSVPEGSYKIYKASLSDHGENYILDLGLVHYTSGISTCMVIPVFYWKLMSKMENKEVVIDKSVTDSER